jgi:hypothetical protein
MTMIGNSGVEFILKACPSLCVLFAVGCSNLRSDSITVPKGKQHFQLGSLGKLFEFRFADKNDKIQSTTRILSTTISIVNSELIHSLKLF